MATARNTIVDKNKKISLEKSSIVEKSLNEEEKLNADDGCSIVPHNPEVPKEEDSKKPEAGDDIGLGKSEIVNNKERYESVNVPAAEEEIKVDYITK